MTFSLTRQIGSIYSGIFVFVIHNGWQERKNRKTFKNELNERKKKAFSVKFIATQENASLWVILHMFTTIVQRRHLPPSVSPNIIYSIILSMTFISLSLSLYLLLFLCPFKIAHETLYGTHLAKDKQTNKQKNVCVYVNALRRRVVFVS